MTHTEILKTVAKQCGTTPKEIDKIVEKLFGTVRNKKITIFGFSFKKNTSDTRYSFKRLFAVFNPYAL